MQPQTQIENPGIGQYYWRVVAKDSYGGQTYGSVWNFQVEVCSGIEADMAGDLFSSFENAPNPFNRSTRISFTLHQSSKIDLIIYNVHGQKIRTLINESNTASGEHDMVWDGKDDAGNTVATGIYICRLESNGKIKSNEMLFVE